MDLESGEGAYRHWPDNHPVVGNLLRSKRNEFRNAGMVPPEILNVALDLLRHFFFLESTGQLARRGSKRIPWKQLTEVLQMALPDSHLAQLDITRATAAVTERKKTVLNSTGRGCVNERDRLCVLFPPLAFTRVPSNECVTDAMLDGLLAELIPSAPTPEVRPQVVRSPISARQAPRSLVVRSPILAPSTLPPLGHLHAHPNPPTSPPPPATIRTARRRLSVVGTPPHTTLVTPVVTAVDTDPVVVAIVPDTAPSLVAVDAEEEDDDLGVQVEPDADEGTAAVDAAAPAIPTAPAPAPVAMAVTADAPALEEAGDPGARLVPNAGGEGRAEPGVRMEADAGGEVAEEGAVAANVEVVVEVPSGDDALALLEERGIRLENVALEGATGDQPTPEQIFEQLIADEKSATTAKGKRRVQLKRLGADPDILSNSFTSEALKDLAEIEAFLVNPENVKVFENRISVARKLGFNQKTEVALNLYFREIFHALVCGKIGLDVVFSLMEKL
mmetsp:Transcript_3287/g.11174  ORF Transcript_3287/g.11174 Transcript_3287/m.11174 type:complete len:503 (-) Transcript_3287:279-1787(-)